MLSIWILPLAFLIYPTFAYAGLQERQTTRVPGFTDTPSYSLAAVQILSQYLPTSVLPGIGVAFESAASSAGVTGDIAVIVTSALNAPTPPPFISNIPSQYQSDIQSVISAISSLRVNASAVADVAYRNATAAAAAVGLNATVLSNGTVVFMNLTSSVGNTADNGTSNGTATVTSTSASGGSGSVSPTASGAGASGGSSKSSKAFAMPTEVPVAAAGILGLVGLLVAL